MSLSPCQTSPAESVGECESVPCQVQSPAEAAGAGDSGLVSPPGTSAAAPQVPFPARKVSEDSDQ